MPYITDVYARRILNSSGKNIVEVEISTESGAFGRASVSSDTIKNSNDDVLKAVDNINNIIGPHIIGYDVRDQLLIDSRMKELLDTNESLKDNSNAVLGVSMAASVCGANFNKQQLYEYYGGFNAHILPTPIISVINCGIDFEDISILPIGYSSFKEALNVGYKILNNIPKTKFKSNEEALKKIAGAIKNSGCKLGTDVVISINVSSDKFYNLNNKRYNLKLDNKILSNEELISYYESLVNNYPICSIIDCLSSDDFEGWKILTKRLGNKIELVGGNLFKTDSNLLNYCIKSGIANSILVKLGQAKTLSDAFNTIEIAKRAGYMLIISSENFENEDTSIVDVAVGTNVGKIKIGPLAHVENTSKYNQLLRIEDTLDTASVYAGNSYIKTKK